MRLASYAGQFKRDVKLAKKPSRDLHIEPDWVLIYCVDGEVVRFERTGTHADLFGN